MVGVAAPYTRFRFSRWMTYGFIAFSMLAISVSLLRFGLPVAVAVSLLPLAILVFLNILRYPIVGFTILFCLNYFVTFLISYTGVDGLSVIFDSLILLTFLSLLLNMAAGSGRYNKLTWNGFIAVALIWMAYCTLELLNASALTGSWIQSRGLTFYMLVAALLTVMVFRDFKDVKMILFVLSVLTLIGVAKGAMQQVIGFDPFERRMLNDGLAQTHLLITGTRYFSIFSSAGIFGAVMGHAMTVFMIAAIYMKGWARTYFLFVGVAAFYGLMISGTRGAIAVPVSGLLLYAILSRRIRLFVPTVSVLAVAYVFLAMTMIGQGNQYIRRMRTVLDPNEPSLVVRKNNQKLFAEYLKDKPFGEGLGLSGVDVKDVPQRFTTSIPTDSWYVKIWVETGIVGLSLYIAILLFIIGYGSYIILFKIRNETLRGVLSALHSGVFGIFVASYGNQVLGQYPVALVVYTSIGLVFMGPLLDKRMGQVGQTGNTNHDAARKHLAIATDIK